MINNIYIYNIQRTETETINSRLIQWQSIVNECTFIEYQNAFNHDNNDNQFCSPRNKKYPLFRHSTRNNDMNEFLSLILSWNGLNIKLTQSQRNPKTLKDYKNKAKNWINGSRAKHYSRTLYPFMIDCAEKYAERVSNLLFININCIGNNNSNLRSIQRQCSSLFYDILMYSYLVELCQCRLRVTKMGRRVYLLCDNSITGHKSNTTSKMLQKYAKNHPYIEQFPSHREEAIDYFNKEKQNSFISLFILYQQRQTIHCLKENELINNIICHGENILNVMDFIKNKCKVNDGKRVILHQTTLDMVLNMVNLLESSDKENKAKIDGLTMVLQEQKDDNVNHHKQESNQVKNDFFGNMLNCLQTQARSICDNQQQKEQLLPLPSMNDQNSSNVCFVYINWLNLNFVTPCPSVHIHIFDHLRTDNLW